jgi:hypothetical protein
MAIQIKNGSKYTIDILDEEGKIYHQIIFNLDDINLPARVLEFYNMAQTEFKKLEEKETEAKQRLATSGIKEIEDIENVTEEQVEILKGDVKYFYQIQLDAFTKLREIIDGLCGSDTCQKIFGDINSYDMFNSFIQGLVPEFEKMGIKMKTMQNNLYKKYKPDNAKVLR